MRKGTFPSLASRKTVNEEGNRCFRSVCSPAHGRPRLNQLKRRISALFSIGFLWLGFFLVTLPCFAISTKLGDLDGDGQPTILDIVIIVSHINGTPRLSNELAVFADVNQ